MKPSVSIIICTLNRAHSLSQTLETIRISAVTSTRAYEVIVVDNGSKDSTEQLCGSFSFEGKSIRYVYEKRTGKGYAYNAGISAAQGNVLLFTDDDVRVPPHWVEEMCSPIFAGHADAVQGGVKIAPHLDRAWLKGALRVWVASVEDPLHRPPGLVGANMAATREATVQVGGFDPRLGPGGSGFFDDTLFGWSLEKLGKRISYRPEIAVEHHFSADRLTVKAYLKSAKRMAVSYAIAVPPASLTTFRPSIASLLIQLPGLFYRTATQTMRLLVSRQPDPGFVLRYYYICRWLALRKQKSH